MSKLLKRLVATVLGAVPAALVVLMTDWSQGVKIAVAAAGVALAHTVLSEMETSASSSPAATVATTASSPSPKTPGA